MTIGTIKVNVSNLIDFVDGELDSRIDGIVDALNDVQEVIKSEAIHQILVALEDLREAHNTVSKGLDGLTQNLAELEGDLSEQGYEE